MVEQNVTIGEFIIRQAHMGEVPIVNGKTDPVLTAVLERLADIRERTTQGQRGWHAVISIPYKPKTRSPFVNILTRLSNRGYIAATHWEFQSVRENGTDGEIYKSLWAKFSGTGEDALPGPIKQANVYKQPVFVDDMTKEQTFASPEKTATELVNERAQPAPPSPIPIQANAPQGIGAAPLAGLPTDIPPDLAPTISKGDEVENTRTKRGDLSEGPRWG